MKLRWKLVSLVVISFIVVAMVLSTVGVKIPVDDVNDVTDPIESYETSDDTSDVPEDLPDTPIAYGTMSFSVTITFKGLAFPTTSPFLGVFNTAMMDVNEFVDLQTGMVYTNEKLDLLEFIETEDNIVIFVRCTITGPDGFNEGWSSDGMKETLNNIGDTTTKEVQSGRIFFWEAGVYTMRATLSILILDAGGDLYDYYPILDDPVPIMLATKMVTFTVVDS